MSSGNPPPHQPPSDYGSASVGGYGVLKHARRKKASFLLGLGVIVCCWCSQPASHFARRSGLLSSAQAAAQAVDVQKHSNNAPASLNLLQSRGAIATGREESDYGLGDCYYKNLKPYPAGGPGERTPFDLWRYAGRGDNSWGSPVLPVSWDKWVVMCQEQKPKLMAEVRAYMNDRYHFTAKALPDAKMSGGKPIMQGPVARLSKGVASYEELAELSAEEIKKRDLFPYSDWFDGQRFAKNSESCKWRELNLTPIGQGETCEE